MARTASATAIGARFKPREPIGCEKHHPRVDRAKKAAGPILRFADGQSRFDFAHHRLSWQSSIELGLQTPLVTACPWKKAKQTRIFPGSNSGSLSLGTAVGKGDTVARASTSRASETNRRKPSVRPASRRQPVARKGPSAARVPGGGAVRVGILEVCVFSRQCVTGEDEYELHGGDCGAPGVRKGRVWSWRGIRQRLGCQEVRFQRRARGSTRNSADTFRLPGHFLHLYR